MKRMIMSIGVLCMAFLLFCGTAMAAEPEVASEYDGIVTIGQGTHGEGSYKVTRKSGATAGQLYLVLIQKGESGDTTSAKPLPTKDNVYFIDVKAADGASIEFDTYPKEMDEGTYIVYLSDYSGDNAGAAKGVAKIVIGGGGGVDTDPAFVPGNIDKDEKGRVNNKDLTALIRYLNDWPEYQEGGDKAIDMRAADVHDDGKNRVNNKDLTALIRHLNDWTEYQTLPYTDK